MTVSGKEDAAGPARVLAQRGPDGAPAWRSERARRPGPDHSWPPRELRGQKGQEPGRPTGNGAAGGSPGPRPAVTPTFLANCVGAAQVPGSTGRAGAGHLTRLRMGAQLWAPPRTAWGAPGSRVLEQQGLGALSLLPPEDSRASKG